MTAHAAASGTAAASIGAGRMCPADYRYPPSVFRRDPDFLAETLYVVGGLYGNREALDAIERMAEAESGRVDIVFNGDFHWFDAEPQWFAGIQAHVLAHRAIRGNIEAEIARPEDIGAGCGCAYPDSVSDETVAYSNAIMTMLQRTARAVDDAPRQLAALPMHIVAGIEGRRIGIVHGDAWSLAGWRFAHDALDDPAQHTRLARLRMETGIDVFACTHTCLPALRDIPAAQGLLTVVNNGSAGMPNFHGARFGLISRISVRPSPHAPAYGTRRDGLHINALAVPYDADAFAARFLRAWPPGSPAHRSYFGRLSNGPHFAPWQAMPQHAPA